MPTTATPSEIARFIIDEHKPSLGRRLDSMPDEAVGMSIVEAVSTRFPGFTPDDLLQALLMAQEMENADLGCERRGVA